MAMTTNLALYDTATATVIRYPRADDEPVVDLHPRYLVLRVVKEDPPQVPQGWTARAVRTVDLDTAEWRWGWELVELPPAPPDYIAFYQDLLGSQTYAAVLSIPATAELARAMVVFVSAIQDAMAGRENRPALQSAIWLLMGQLTLDQNGLVELAGMMATHNLDTVYQLQP